MLEKKLLFKHILMNYLLKNILSLIKFLQLNEQIIFDIRYYSLELNKGRKRNLKIYILALKRIRTAAIILTDRLT